MIGNHEVMEVVLGPYADVHYDRGTGATYYRCVLCESSASHVLVNPQTKRARGFCSLHRPAEAPDLLTMAEFVLLAFIRCGRAVRRCDHPDGYTHMQWSGPSGRFSEEEDRRWAETLAEYGQEGGFC